MVWMLPIFEAGNLGLVVLLCVDVAGVNFVGRGRKYGFMGVFFRETWVEKAKFEVQIFVGSSSQKIGVWVFFP